MSGSNLPSGDGILSNNARWPSLFYFTTFGGRFTTQDGVIGPNRLAPRWPATAQDRPALIGTAPQHSRVPAHSAAELSQTFATARMWGILGGIERSNQVASVDRTIAQLNIEHYRRLLAKETDENRLLVLQRLLAEEEAKLRDLTPPAGKRRAP